MEWARLVRLCASLSGNADVAEDLAQETLIEAWRHAQSLRNPDALRPWLSGIARNVCLRWSRGQAREAATLDRFAQSDRERTASSAAPASRDELILDRALGLLPVPTRDVLVQHYIDERPHGEIAVGLGVSDGAVAVRIHRGKVALRQALARPELGADANLRARRSGRPWLAGDAHLVPLLRSASARGAHRSRVRSYLLPLHRTVLP
jgi:RNA polymerase sigma-70 factor (ECF subfamily)